MIAPPNCNLCELDSLVRERSRLAMSEELIDRMKDRVRQLRKVQQLAHDPRMIDAIQKITDEGEADIAKLERTPPAGA